MNALSAQNIQVNKLNLCQENDTLLLIDTIIHTKPVLSRTWNFGDGETQVTGVNFTNHIYRTNGSFIPSLTITYADLTTSNHTTTGLINVYPNPTAQFTVDFKKSCPNVELKFDQFSSSSNGFITNFILDLGDGTIDSLFNNTKSYAYSFAGIYDVTMKVIDMRGCVAIATEQIDIRNYLPFRIFNETNYCRDSLVKIKNVSLDIENTTNWKWTIIDGNDRFTNFNRDLDFTWTNFGVQQVYLEGTNVYRCKRQDTFDIFIDSTALLQFNMPVDTTICFGDKLNLVISGGNNIFLDPNTSFFQQVNSNTFLLEPRSSYLYKFYNNNSYCLRSEKSLLVRVQPKIEFSLSADPESIIFGGNSNLKINSKSVLDSVLWNATEQISCRKCDSTIVSPNQTTTYIATVYQSLSNKVCQAQDTLTVTVLESCEREKIQLPNAFLPGQNKNDVFYVKSSRLRDIIEFQVYDRWGNAVFSRQNIPPNDKNYGWNGKIQNDADELPSGMYIYSITAKCDNNENIIFKGEVNLIR
jgi:gliding motility-associated-like protein